MVRLIRKLDYLYRTGKGQYIQFLNRISQELRLSIPVEPRSKNGINEKEKKIFQLYVHKQMTKLKRRTFQSNVIIEIDFFSTISNPPQIHTLTKNYLDLLSAPIDNTQINRKNLLYKDDRQIKVLIANHHVEKKHNSPKINIKIARLSNFIKDLKLIQQIEINDFDCDARDSNIDIDELLESKNTRHYGNWLEKYEIYNEIKASERLYDTTNNDEPISNLFLHRAQQSFFTELNFDITDLARIFIGNENKEISNANESSGYLSEILDIIDKFIEPNYRKFYFSLKDITRMTIFDLPRKKGETKKFRNKISEILDQYTKQFPFLDPLLVNLSLVILYIAPKGVEIDLDNLARRVIPYINQKLKPLGTWYHRVNKESGYIQKTITEYQIIQLPREKEDPRKGAIKILLFPKIPFKNVWEDAQSLIFDWNDHVN